MTQGTTDIPVSKVAIPQTRIRSLIGWFDPTEAIQAVLGRLPTPGDDLSVATATYELTRAAVENRTPMPVLNPIATGNRELLESITIRPEVQAIFNGGNPRAEWIDLRYVQSAQKTIDLGRLDERLESAARDEERLIELCLPSQPPGTEITMAPDPDGRAITFSSANQNLRVQQFGCQGPVVNVALGVGAPYVTVAHFEGRYFLQDGYHRATGLLRLGVTVAPAIVIDVPSYTSVFRPGGGFFDHAVVTRPAPPLVSDFWDDSVTSETTQPVSRRFVRVSVAEFNV